MAATSWRESHSVNLSAQTRSLILKVGYQLQGQIIHSKNLRFDADPKVKYVDIQRTIGTNHNEGHDKLIDIRTIKLWWDRRHEYETTASVKPAPRSGRPPHPAFSTEEKRNEVFEYALDLPLGHHQKDVMNRFNIRSKNTLYKYTKNDISWVFTPRQHANDNEEVKQKRIDYANWAITATGRPTRKILKATFVDHKLCTFFGLNKMHNKQAKRKGAGYETLDHFDYLLKNPCLMVYFACNRNGVASFIHANKRRKKRGPGYTVDIWKVDHEDCIEAWQYEFAQFMEDTDSDYVICDGVKCNTKKRLLIV